MCNLSQGIREEGREEGRAEGRAEGRLEGRLEGHAEGKTEERRNLIANMYQNSISIEQIAQIVKITVDEVKGILGGAGMMQR